METRLDKLDKKDETENHPPLSNQVFFPKMFEFKYRRVIAPHKDFVLLQRDPISREFSAHLKFFILACCLQCNYLRYDFKNKKYVLYSRKLEIGTRCQDDYDHIFGSFQVCLDEKCSKCYVHGRTLPLSAPVLCAVLNVNKLHMQVPSCTCILTRHAILVFNATGN